MSSLIFTIPYDTIGDIPLSEYKNLHRKYWTFIADNHLNYKPHIYNERGKYSHIMSNCFACQYSKLFLTDHFKECVCPIKSFRNKDGYCSYCSETIYQRWTRIVSRLYARIHGNCQEKADKIALKIANLEWEDYRDTESENKERSFIWTLPTERRNEEC